MLIKFSSNGWEDYLHWQTTDRALLKRINQLIKDIERDPFSGIGKPEPLKHQLSGFWSRRIDLNTVWYIPSIMILFLSHNAGITIKLFHVVTGKIHFDVDYKDTFFLSDIASAF